MARRLGLSWKMAWTSVKVWGVEAHTPRLTAPLLALFWLAAPGALAGENVPPSNIFGKYGNDVEACYMSTTESDQWDCAKDKVHDSLELTKRSDGTIYLKLKLHFFNGHTCEIDGPAKWIKGKVKVIDFNYDGTPDPCYLRMSATSSAITLHDDNGKCTEYYCGTRGMLDGVTLPREKAVP